MNTLLRVVLMVSSVLVALFILLRIRKKHLNIDDAMYWLFFSLLILVLGIFPDIAEWAANLIGVDAASNFVFLVMIFLILIKLFYVCIDLSIQKQRLTRLIQRLALMNKEMRDEERGKITEVAAELIEAELHPQTEETASSDEAKPE